MVFKGGPPEKLNGRKIKKRLSKQEKSVRIEASAGPPPSCPIVIHSPAGGNPNLI
jgi:hypothetical protein